MRSMRDNYERGLYEGEEYQYWQKINSLKEKLALLTHLPELSFERAARTLLNLRESWEWATKEERKALAQMMIQAVRIDMAEKRMLQLNVSPDFDVLFQLLANLQVDEERRFWLISPEGIKHICNEALKVQEGMEVKPSACVSHNALTSLKEVVK